MSGLLRINRLKIRYGDVVALDDVTVEVPFGASVAVIGPNGSGKSTLLKAMAGIVRPTSGTVDLSGCSSALVLQSTDVDRSVPLTVRDTVTMARFPRIGLLGRLRTIDRNAIDRAVQALGLEELLDRQIHELSGGQRQRVFVAQGLAQDADLLLLDEPLTGLDVVSRSMIADVLDRASSAGRTTVITTHSFAEAEKCDLVMLLATQCIAFGPPATVFTESNLRRAFGGRFVKVGDTLVLDDPHHEHDHVH
ncbi:MAG: metal ABC transporter ATP-binding protein [Acidimicrobiales bacterium]